MGSTCVPVNSNRTDTRLFCCSRRGVFPYFFPLQICDPLYISLHAGGAVLLHLFADVPIHIQRKGGCGMAEVALHGFDVITVLEGEDRMGVSQVMHPGVGRTDFRCEFFEVDVNGLRAEVSSQRGGKDKSTLVLFLAFPALPLPAPP